MVTNKLKELEATRAKLASLEQSIASELHKELAGLPAKYGFDSVAAFVQAVQAASGGRRGRRAGKAAGPKAGKTKSGRKPRAVITDETRAQVKKLVAAGKTGGEIAKELDLSLPSVQNIKKALGLVKKR
ncbi:MAG TPA: helix-turn-helix domain-containing protein [Opitutaceae bacterium]|nr:helix-turn-helix domain-containing protein [Opitutaceae bacterium]